MPQHSRPQPTKGRTSSRIAAADARIKALARDRLASEASITRIGISVLDGWIDLTGEVDWYYQKDAVEQCIRRLAGVRGVSSGISVRRSRQLPLETGPSTVGPGEFGADLCDAISQVLHRSRFFAREPIVVRRKGSRILLTGYVHSPYDREMAVSAARSVAGNIEIESDLVVG